MVVFTCFGPKKEPFVAQPSLTEWQDWTNRGWRAVSSYTAYVLIALSCDQFLLHVSLSKSTGEELVAFLLHALLWWYSLAARERWPYGGMKNADMTDREMRKEKHWWSMHFQDSDLEVISTALSPTIHLPVSILVFLALITVKVLGSLYWCMSIGRYPKPFQWGFKFCSVIARQCIPHSNAQREGWFLSMPLTTSDWPPGFRSLDYRKAWHNLNFFLVFCLRTASAVDSWTSVQKKMNEFCCQRYFGEENYIGILPIEGTVLHFFVSEAVSEGTCHVINCF